MLRAISARHSFYLSDVRARGAAWPALLLIKCKVGRPRPSGGGRRGISGVTDGSSWIVVRLAAALAG